MPIAAFFLGYLICYLEFTGHGWGGFAAGVIASSTVVARMAGGSLLQNASKRLTRIVWKRLKHRRWFRHHAGHHVQLHAKGCPQC